MTYSLQKNGPELLNDCSIAHSSIFKVTKVHKSVGGGGF